MIAIDATFYCGTQMTRFHLYQVVPRIGETVELDFGEGYEYYFVRTVRWPKLRGGHACGTVPVEIDVTKA